MAEKSALSLPASRASPFILIAPLVLCSSASNRLITAKDHASVQLNIGHLDENGLYLGQFTTFALSGFVRAQVREGNFYQLSKVTQCVIFSRC
jgi:hypothetical protein